MIKVILAWDRWKIVLLLERFGPAWAITADPLFATQSCDHLSGFHFEVQAVFVYLALYSCTDFMACGDILTVTQLEGKETLQAVAKLRLVNTAPGSGFLDLFRNRADQFGPGKNFSIFIFVKYFH